MGSILQDWPPPPFSIDFSGIHKITWRIKPKQICLPLSDYMDLDGKIGKGVVWTAIV